MAHEAQSLFTKYILTEEEELAAVQFTELQRQYMQTIIAEAAEEKVRLTFNPTAPTEFQQREAELQGRMLILLTLLSKESELIESIKPI